MLKSALSKQELITIQLVPLSGSGRLDEQATTWNGGTMLHLFYFLAPLGIYCEGKQKKLWKSYNVY